MAEIRFEHVSKSFDANTVVDDLDLSIADGELMVLVGPSGCGKTTALRMLAGLEELESGTIVIDGEVVNDLEPRDRDVAMVFQNYALYPHLSVFQNMAFGLRLHHEPKDEIERRVREAARVLQLEELLERKPKQLSGGQRQRVAMGRAIVRQPKVFLMDEPLSNLDAKLRVQMRAQIARLQRTLAVTMLYVTHDQVEAMTLGHRVAVMRLGVLQQVAPPQELYTPAGQSVRGELHRLAGDERGRGRAAPRIRRPAGALRTARHQDRPWSRRRAAGARRATMAVASCSACGRRTSRTRPWSTRGTRTARSRLTVELRENLGSEVDVHVGINAPVPALEAVIEATESADTTGEAGVAGRPEGIFVARLGAGHTGARGPWGEALARPPGAALLRSRQRRAIYDDTAGRSFDDQPWRRSSPRRPAARSTCSSPATPCPT